MFVLLPSLYKKDFPTYIKKRIIKVLFNAKRDLLSVLEVYTSEKDKIKEIRKFYCRYCSSSVLEYSVVEYSYSNINLNNSIIIDRHLNAKIGNIFKDNVMGVFREEI